MSHNWKCGVDTVWIFPYPVNRMWNKMSHYADSSMDSGVVEELSASIIMPQKLKDSKTTYKLLGPWKWKQRDPLQCVLLSAVHIRSFSIRLESVYISIYFCLSYPERGYGLQDIEHVNSIYLCQYTLQYIIINTSSSEVQCSHCRISSRQKVEKYFLIQTYISVIRFHNMLIFKINELINSFQDKTLKHKRIAEQ